MNNNTTYGSNVAPFLDAASLQDRESSLVTSLRSSQHRSLQANNCMEDLFGKSLSNGCNAQDMKFLGVTGVQVYDPGAYQDESGIWQNACRGKDDYVNLAFTADIEVSADRYDVGMYINIEGGSAMTGTCMVSLLSDTNFQLGTVPPEQIAVEGGIVEIGEFETGADADYCPDYQGSGILRDFAFSQLRLKCADDDSNGLLDFDIAFGKSLLVTLS
jgi:hypothetical protein